MLRAVQVDVARRVLIWMLSSWYVGPFVLDIVGWTDIVGSVGYWRDMTLIADSVVNRPLKWMMVIQSITWTCIHLVCGSQSCLVHQSHKWDTCHTMTHTHSLSIYIWFIMIYTHYLHNVCICIYIYNEYIYIYIIHIQETYRSEHSILHLTKALALSLADEELREETADFHTAVPYEINYRTIRQAETPRIPWFMNVYDVYDHFPSFSIIFPINMAIWGYTAWH